MTVKLAWLSLLNMRAKAARAKAKRAVQVEGGNGTIVCIGYSDACAWSVLGQCLLTQLAVGDVPDYQLAQKEMGNSLCFWGSQGPLIYVQGSVPCVL